MQGFHRALKPALLKRWHVSAHDLMELCRGGPLNPRANFGIRRSFTCCVHADVPRQLAAALYEVRSAGCLNDADVPLTAVPSEGVESSPGACTLHALACPPPVWAAAQVRQSIAAS